MHLTYRVRYPNVNSLHQKKKSSNETKRRVARDTVTLDIVPADRHSAACDSVRRVSFLYVLSGTWNML